MRNLLEKIAKEEKTTYKPTKAEVTEALLGGGLAGLGAGAGVAANSYALTSTLNQQALEKAKKAKDITSKQAESGYKAVAKKIGKSRADWLLKKLDFPMTEKGKPDFSTVGQEQLDVVPKLTKATKAKAALASATMVGLPVAAATTLGLYLMNDKRYKRVMQDIKSRLPGSDKSKVEKTAEDKVKVRRLKKLTRKGTVGAEVIQTKYKHKGGLVGGLQESGLVSGPKEVKTFYEPRPPRSKSRLKFKKPKVKLVEGVADDAYEVKYDKEEGTIYEPRKLPK